MEGIGPKTRAQNERLVPSSLFPVQILNTLNLSGLHLNEATKEKRTPAVAKDWRILFTVAAAMRDPPALSFATISAGSMPPRRRFRTMSCSPWEYFFGIVPNAEEERRGGFQRVQEGQKGRKGN